MIVRDPEILGVWYNNNTNCITGEIIDPEKMIEMAARNCWQSSDRITESSHFELFERMLKMGHMTPFEFSNIAIRVITDRGVLAEITRHRIASFAVKSTRYCNDTKATSSKDRGCTYIRPVFVEEDLVGKYDIVNNFSEIGEVLPYTTSLKSRVWFEGCQASELSYMRLGDKREDGGCASTPQESRTMLNNSTETEIYMNVNCREMMHIISLRADKAAHPEIQRIIIPVADMLTVLFPSIFGCFNNKIKERMDFFELNKWNLAKIK